MISVIIPGRASPSSLKRPLKRGWLHKRIPPRISAVSTYRSPENSNRVLYTESCLNQGRQEEYGNGQDYGYPEPGFKILYQVSVMILVAVRSMSFNAFMVYAMGMFFHMIRLMRIIFHLFAPIRLREACHANLCDPHLKILGKLQREV